MPTILVVDDEELVRKWVAIAISSFGRYEVLEAGDAQSAFQIAAECPIDLLLSDCVMQGPMSGPDLARKVTASRKHVKVILMSGYEGNDHLQLEQGWRFLQKPFLPAALRAMIMEVLGERPKAPAVNTLGTRGI